MGAPRRAFDPGRCLQGRITTRKFRPDRRLARRSLQLPFLLAVVSQAVGAGGVCLFTTPAREWAERFRQPSALSQAEFVLASGSTVLVPSQIPPLDQQIRIIDEAGLHLIEVQGLTPEKLSGPPSPKLLLTAETLRLSIVRGFMAQKI
jgi:hypothetical protein